MDEISKSLASPGWWISVFLVGILVNIISAYLKPLLDRYGLRFRRFVGMSVETGRAMHAENVSKLRNDPDTRLVAHIEELRTSLLAIRSNVSVLLYLFLSYVLPNDGQTVTIVMKYSLIALAFQAMIRSISSSWRGLTIRTQLADAEETNPDKKM